MRLKAGDQVTVQVADDVPVILTMQRHATVTRAVDGGYMVAVDCSSPDEWGPVPLTRLSRGWRNESGAWR